MYFLNEDNILVTLVKGTALGVVATVTMLFKR